MALSCVKTGLKVPPRVQDLGSDRQSRGRTQGALSPSPLHPHPPGYGSWRHLLGTTVLALAALLESAATWEGGDAKCIQAGSRQVASPCQQFLGAGETPEPVAN